MNKIFLFLFILTSNYLIGQEYTYIDGKIINQSGGKVMASFYPTTTKFEKANVMFDINPAGEFEALLTIEVPQVVQIKYGNHQVDLFVKPDERLGLLIDPDLNETYFEKDKTQDNAIYKKMIPSNKKEKSVYISNIAIPKSKYQKLKPLGSEERYQLIESDYKEELNLLGRNAHENQSEVFQKFIQEKINFDFLSMAFLLVDKKDLANKAVFNNLITEFISSENKVINTSALHKFLFLYTKSNCETALEKELDYYQDFTMLFDCINSSGEINENHKSSLLGALLYLNLRPERIEEVDPLYKSFVRSNTDQTLVSELAERYDMAASFRSGQSAPAFSLVNLRGDEVHLKDFIGKKVYLSFWASWCGPCKHEIINSAENRALLKNEAIEFVYISIDEKKSKWMAHKITTEQSGIHLWGGVVKKELMQDFGIATIPRTFLLNEKGQFINKFPAPTELEFIDFIKNN